MGTPNIIKFVKELADMNLPAQHKKFYTDFLEKARSFDYGTKSDTLETWVRINNAKSKECYKNSLLLAMVVDEIEYVEGYMFTSQIPFPIEHAWNFHNEYSHIIDTTAHVSKFSFDTEEYLGVVIPKEILQKYLDTDQTLTALQYYLINLQS